MGKINFFQKWWKRTPIAWAQMSREKTRLVIAIAGITFADFLIFMQLGFQDALFESTRTPYKGLNADIILANPQYQTLIAVEDMPRERLYQAQGFPGVASVTPVYLGLTNWTGPCDRKNRSILIFGVNPTDNPFLLPEINANIHHIRTLNSVLFDRTSRSEFGPIPQLLSAYNTTDQNPAQKLAQIKSICETETQKYNPEYKYDPTKQLLHKQPQVATELGDQLITVRSLFTMGASFGADGNVIVSDTTFHTIFSRRKPDRMELGLIRLVPGTNIKQIQAQLKEALPKDVVVLTKDEMADVEKKYWETGTAIGFIFTLGVGIGFVVGIVIVYQILYSDVSDHLPEYATLKAMGYSDRNLLSILGQEALMLAVLGFLPSLVIASGFYQLTRSTTLLPVIMDVPKASKVFVLTIMMCTGSGVIASRKLLSADPADIF